MARVCVHCDEKTCLNYIFVEKESPEHQNQCQKMDLIMKRVEVKGGLAVGKEVCCRSYEKREEVL